MGAPAAAPRPRPQYAGRPKLRKLPSSARNLKTKPGPRTRPGPNVARKRPSASKSPRPKMNVYRSRSFGVAASQGAAAIPVVAGRAAVRMRELPDSGLVVRLTQGRAWIGVLCSLLVGIVALNVLSLGLNATSGQTSVQVDALERDNSALRADIAEKTSAAKVQDAATSFGLAIPDPGDIGYLNFSDSVLGQAAKVLAGQASSAAASVTPQTLGDGSSSSSSSTGTVSPTPASTTPSSSTSTSTPTVTPTPAPTTSSPPPSSSGGGGGVSAGL